MLVTGRALASDPARDRTIAIRGGGEAMSYRQLRADAERIAAARWNRAPRDGAFAGLVMDDTPDALATFLGLVHAGWAVGVIDGSAPPAELHAAVAQLDPSLLVVPGEIDPQEPDWVDVGTADGGLRVACAPGVAGLGELAVPDADAPFYVGFTSGSAGRPKAFVRSHRSWWESFERFSSICGLPDGRVIIPGPLSSSHFLFGALHGLHVGATVELAESVADALCGDEPIAGLYVVPGMLGQLVARGRPKGVCDPRFIFCAGARLDEAVVEATRRAFPESALVEYYGASELSFVALRRHGDGAPARSVGRPFPGVEVRVVDDGGMPVPAGDTGQIVVRSDLVFLGYRGERPVGAARELPDRWWGVGDRGTLDAAGYLFVEGRGTSLIISGGVNIQPEEVEEALVTAPGVMECVVVGLADDRWGETICAAVVIEPGVAVSRASLREHLESRLGRPKRPRRYVVVDGPLPIGRSGKVDRAAVRDRLRLGREL